MRRLIRFVGTVTLVAFVAACTKHVPIDPDVAARESYEIDGTVEFHLIDGRTIVSDDVSVSDSTFRLRNVRGERSPITLERAEIESMEQISKNYRPVWIVGGAALLVLMLFFAFTDEPGFGDD